MSVCKREQEERDRMLLEIQLGSDIDLLAALCQARWELSVLRAEREETLAVAADAIAAAGQA